jgi:signal transduction histidine kinase
MALVPTVVSVGVEAAAAVLLGQTTWRTLRVREQPSATPFIALLATLTLWAVFRIGADLPAVTPGEVLSTVCSVGGFGAALLLPGFWVVYALAYTGRGTGVTRARIAMFAGILLPVVLGGAIVYTGSSETEIIREAAPLLAWQFIYLFGLWLYGTYLLVGFGRGHPRVSTTQVAVVTGGVTAPYLLSNIWGASELVAGTSLGLLAAGGLLAVAVRRYPVTTGFPKADYVARTRVVETLQEAVLVLDWDGHVLDVNRTTTELFDTPAGDMIGEPVRSVVDGLDRADLTVGSTGTVSLQTARGRRQFQFSVSAVTDSSPEDSALARTVLLRDVTGQQTRRQRLSVLNRILRHNVRNDLDAVLAYADLVDDEEVRAGIRTNVTDTLQLSAKAREAEDVMTAVTEPPEPVDLAAVAASVAEQLRSEHPGELSVDCPDEPEVVSHRSIVRRVLTELVENALVHSGGDPPRVEVTVRDGPDGGAELVVADHGPGLPEREREILASGTETQLKHGQGIGLWFVNWAVTQLGGELEFDHNDPAGSVVTVRLYDTVG